MFNEAVRSLAESANAWIDAAAISDCIETLLAMRITLA